MLQSFRGATGGIILKIFMGLIVLSFGIWGIGDLLRSSGGSNTAATVGSVSISNAKLAEEVRRQTAIIRQRFGGDVPEAMLKAMNVDRMVLKQLVQDELLKQGADRTGLAVGDSIITKLIAGNPAFRDKEGKFDRELFRQALWNKGQDEAGYIEDLKHDVSVMFLVQALTANTDTPRVKLDTLHKIANQKRSASYINITAKSVTLPAKVDEKAVHEYYKTHETDFALPEERGVSYIAFTKQDIGKDSTPEALYALANKVEDALAGGSSLAEIAKNLDLKLKKAEGLKANMNPKGLPDGAVFVRQAFEVQQGNDSSLTLSQDQSTYYVLHVDGVKPSSVQPLDKVKDRVVASWKAEELDHLMREKAEKIADRLQKGEKLEAVAKAEKLEVKHSKLIQRGEKSDVSADFLQQLFETSKGAVKGVYPVAGGGYMTGELLEVQDAKPLNDKEAAALQEQLREGNFEDLLSEYTLYSQQKTPVKVNKSANREAE